MVRPVAGQCLQGIPIGADEGFLLGARPTLDLSLGNDRVGYTLEDLMPDQRDGAPAFRITLDEALVVLRHADIERAAGGPT